MQLRRVIFLTGAGISAESGVPTFRSGDHALWDEYRLDEVCNIDTFEENYAKVHAFYNRRRVELGRVEPNQAHHAIAQLQQRFGDDRVLLMTTNIDDLHERAGSQHVRHIHGNLLEMINLDDERVVSLGYEAFDPAATSVRHKPNVVFFGEPAPMYGELYALLKTLTRDDLVVVIGSSEKVIPFCMEAHRYSNGDARILYVDPSERTAYDDYLIGNFRPFDFHHCMPATAGLGEEGAVTKAIEVWMA